MADVISRLKLESGEFDSKIKRAAQGIQRMVEECHNAGGILNKLEDENRAYIQSLGSMATVATTAKGKLAELTAAFTDIRSQYNKLSEEEKNGEVGQELNKQLDIMKGRINDAKTELSDINKELGNTGKQSQETGGFLDKLKDRFVVNLDAMKLFELGLKAAEGALNVMKDAFFSNEVSLDAWGRTVAASESLYKGFLDALNTGDISGYLANMGDIVTAAQNAYDAIDDLNTFNAFNKINRQRFRAGFTNAVADFREGKGSKEAVKSAAGAYIGNLREEQGMQYNAYMQAVNNIAKSRGVDGFALMAALGGKYGDFKALKNTRVTQGSRLRLAGGALTRELVYMPANDREKVAYAVQRLNDTDIDYLQGIGANVFSTADQINSIRKQTARVLNSNSGGGRSGGGGGRSGGRGGGRGNGHGYEPKTQVIDMKPMEGLGMPDIYDRWGNKIEIPQARPLTPEQRMRNEILTQGQGILSSIPSLAFPEQSEEARAYIKRKSNQYDREQNYAKLGEKFDESSKTWADMNSNLNNIVAGVEGLGIEVPSGFKKMIGLTQTVSTIMSGISSILLLINTTQWTSKLIPGIGLHAGGVVRAATGTVVPGNYGFDAVPALLTSGETVLTRAQAGNIASQLQQGSKGESTMQPYTTGEYVYLGVKNHLQRNGQGEIVTTGMLRRMGLIA